MLRTMCVSAALLLTCAVGASSTTWIVDVDGGGDFSTIGAGVAAAASDDTVLVMPGTYTGSQNRYIDFSGKELVVRSSSGPESTVIDCENSGGAFWFHSHELPGATVEGFTITNGQATHGGAFNIDVSSSCTIRDCILQDCEATSGDGGGINCEDGSQVYVYDTTFRENLAQTFGGGAMIWEASATFRGCHFETNHALFTGGGLYVAYGADALVASCTFVGNTAYYYGGGILCAQAAGTVEDCTFYANSAGTNGAGIYCNDCSPTIVRTIVSHSYLGGGIACSETAADPQISHCNVFANAGGDSLCGTYYDNLYVDPLYCDASSGDLSLCSDSPCLPNNNGWAVTMGGIGQGCEDCGTGLPDREKSWGLIKAMFR